MTTGSAGAPAPALYAVGPRVHPGDRAVSGQKVIFQLNVDVLERRGWEVSLFDIGERDRRERRTKGRVSLARIVDYLRILPKVLAAGVRGRRGVVYLTTAQSLPGFLRDLVIIWSLSLLGHRVICHQFGGNYDGFFAAQRSPVRALIRKTLARASAVIVEGELVKEQFSFLPDPDRKVRIVPNTLAEPSPLVPEEGKGLGPDEPIRLLYLSNMLETKGYWDVLEAVEILLRRGRRVHCRFAGEFLVTTDSTRFRDPDRAREAFLAHLRERPELAAAVTYDRRLSGEPKARAFRDAHVFLLPSNYVVEGLPVSIVEAMAYGCVTLATRYRMIPSLVEDGGTGFFVPYNDPTTIADKVEYLADHPDVLRRMSGRALERFAERFAPERHAERITRVFQEVLDAEPGR